MKFSPVILTLFFFTLVCAPKIAPAMADEVSEQQEVILKVGMDHDTFVALLKKHGARDISFNMNTAGNVFGGGPLLGVYWRFENYDAVIAITANKGKVASIRFWNNKDFENRGLISGKKERIKSFKLNPATNRVAIVEAE